MAHDDTRTFQEKLVRRKKSKPIAAVLVAHSPKWGQDRAAVNESITIGRDDDCELTIEDINTSRRHTRIVSKGKKHWISDLGSKNGTHVNGSQIRDSVKIEDGAIIRIGNTILVFVKDARGMLDTRAERHRLIAGSFHSAEIVRKLANCSRMGHNILLAGPSGCGKEVAARAFAELLRRPLEVQNAARYSSEEEATSTLFGVGKKVFSNVDERQGFIEKADGGIFFLDEAHNLPRRVQKSLLRVVEDGKIGRIGETDSKEVDVRFVFASNEPPKSFGLEKDLLARLMVIEIPPLNERPADIPDIFDRLLNEAQLRAGVSLQLTRESVRASQYETLMLDGFEQDNVRGLIKIADAIATRAATGLQPEMAIDEIFDELYNTQYGSSRDAGFGDLKFTKQIEKADNTSSGKVSDIEAAYYKHGGNVAAI